MTRHQHLGADVQSALKTDMTIDISTNGRTSGLPRRIEIWFLNIEGEIYITGTSGQRDWFANLAADPNLVFHLKETIKADLDAVAEIVTDPAERRRVFEARTAEWYRKNEPLDQLIADAPMVRLRFI